MKEGRKGETKGGGRKEWREGERRRGGREGGKSLHGYN